jgi:hypothetical protein
LAAVLCSIALLVPVSAQASGSPSGSTPLHLRFRIVARNVSTLSSSGDYIGYARLDEFGDAEPLVALDDRTGARTLVGGCGMSALGSPWVAFDCISGGFFQLFDIRTRTWHYVRCDRLCDANSPWLGGVIVGARWLGLQIDPHAPCGDGEHNSCGPTTYLFYNIASGRSRTPRVGPTTIVDLDSPTLTRRLCAPLAEPTSPPGTPPFPPDVTFYGRFALLEAQTGIYLQRCGSRLNVPLVTAGYAGQLVGNQQAVAFCPASSAPGSGIFLPSLRRFMFTLPRGTYSCWAAALGPRHLYILDTQRRLLFAAPLGPGP